VLRGLYPDTVVYLDSGRYYFHTINTDLQLSEYLEENFVTDENGRMTYMGDDGVITHTGIDVSKFQGEIDWAKVKESGIEFAIIRAGLRGYGAEGKIVEDETYRANIEAAIANGIKVGVYFFSQAVNEREAIEEADFVTAVLNGRRLDLPVMFDWEPVDQESSRTDGAEKRVVTACAAAFCRRVAASGYSAGVYFNRQQGYYSYDLSQLKDYAFWVAEPGDRPSFYYAFRFWQYSFSGTVPGINTVVDRDLMFGEGGTAG
jgi:GH25 family lysozyme M1 (1,4-beta-N-acetylmuramidase)